MSETKCKQQLLLEKMDELKVKMNNLTNEFNQLKLQINPFVPVATDIYFSLKKSKSVWEIKLFINQFIIKTKLSS